MVIQKLAQRPIVAREKKKKEIQVGNIILTKARTIEQCARPLAAV